MILKAFSKDDTTILKGIGILTIVAHNYFHWIKPIVNGNEFNFQYNSFTNFIQSLQNHPLEGIHLIFSYYGHYGVQIFIFLSAFGLTMKYGEKIVPYRNFVKERLLKFYPAFIITLLVFLALSAVRGHLLFGIVIDELLFVLLLSNVIPGKALVQVGPWWYFVMAMQLYLVFPSLLRLYKKYGKLSLISLSIFTWLIMVFVNPTIQTHNLNFRHSFIGYLPELSFGIYLAYKKTISISSPLLLILLFVFVLGNIDDVVWSLSSPAVLLLAIAGFQKIYPYMCRIKTVILILNFYGSISFYCFLVHGFLRGPFNNFANNVVNPIISILLFFPYILVTTVVALGIKYIEKIVKTTDMAKICR